MKVPLSAKRIAVYDKQKLKIWANGEKHIVDAPFRPYFYSGVPLNTAGDMERVSATRLSDFTETTFYRHNFNVVSDIPKNRISGQTYEDNIPFVFRVRADEPDFYLQYPHEDDLRFLFFDIEQTSPPDAAFPTSNDNITNIAYCTDKNRNIQPLNIKKSTKSDKGMLSYFSEIVKDVDPDIYVYYNKSYDLPMMIRRMERNKLDTSMFSKDKSKVSIFDKGSIHVEGCEIYDPYVDISGDQALNGNVTGRGLKPVSNYFGFKAEVEPLDFDEEPIYKMIGTEKLKIYNADDVRRLLLVFDIYYNNVQLSAERLQIPLNLTIGLNKRDLGIIVLGEEFRKRNIIADGLNKDRYPEIFQRQEVLDKKVAAYQGALSNIKRFGKFKPIIKADASSMYPNIMRHFNLSHDTTQIIEYLDYNKDGFKIEDKDDYFLYYIPDDKIKKIVVIRVYKEEGFTTKLVKQFLEDRAKWKRKYKETKDKRYKTLSDIEKVKANGGIYGIQGNARHPYGHVPIAIATTGFGREAMKLLIVTLEEIYPNSVIEWDTDGVYFTAEDFDEIDIWQRFDEKIEEKFGQRIVLDIGFDEPWDEGWFHRTKNYILRKGDIIEMTGVSMKSSKFCNIERQLIVELAKAKLGDLNEREVVAKYSSLSGFKKKDFAMKTGLGKSIKSYIGRGRGAISYRMAVDAQHLLNIPPETGNEYYYVKTLDGYELLQAPDIAPIDYNYYIKKINGIIKRFKSKHDNVSDMTNFYGTKMEQKEQRIEDDWQFDEEEVKIEKKVKEEKKIAKLSDFY